MKTNSESDLTWLNYARECIEEIREYTGSRRETFEGSRMVQRAVERVLQTLAESTQRLGADLKATEPEIPWEKIGRFRNAMVHGYRHIDQEIVWNIIEEELPKLGRAIERMMERASSAERPAPREQTKEPPAEAAQQSDREKAIAERAGRIHRMRLRHVDPAVRADAHIHVAALEANASTGAEMLEKAIADDGEIGDEPELIQRLNEGATHLRQGRIETMREAAVRAVNNAPSASRSS